MLCSSSNLFIDGFSRMVNPAAQMLRATSADAWWERIEPIRGCVCVCVCREGVFEEQTEAL